MQSNTPKYTQAQLGRFRKGLLKLLQDGPSNVDYGVCYNLDFELRTVPEYEWYDAYAFVDAEAAGWSHARLYEDGRFMDYFAVQDKDGELWEGENLKMRKNLIQYLLGRVAHHEAMLRGGVAL